MGQPPAMRRCTFPKCRVMTISASKLRRVELEADARTPGLVLDMARVASHV